MVDRQGTQQHGVDQPEGCGASADGQAERQNRGSRSHFAFDELSPAEDHIRPQRIEPREQPDVTAFITCRQQPPKCLADFDGVATILDRLVDVGLEFFSDFSIEAFTAPNVCDTGPQ